MPTIDLTQTLFHQMPVFPGEARPSILEDQLPPNAGYVTYRLESNMHTGTHIDAPYHAKADLLTIDSYPAELFCGKAKALDVRNIDVVRIEPGWEDIFREYEVILFNTGHDKHWNTPAYYRDYPVFSDEIAFAMKEYGVRIAGFDSPSPDKSPFDFHSVFLNHGRFLVENLCGLDRLIHLYEFEFMAFPLKIQAEASLLRAIARY
ncbi:MAG: cyclase family protein [Bacteroidetes bacterium]|nr:cyclase family protein [Bacteroidota bacterium]